MPPGPERNALLRAATRVENDTRAVDRARLAQHVYQFYDDPKTPSPLGYEQIMSPQELARYDLKAGDLAPWGSRFRATLSRSQIDPMRKPIIAFRGTDPGKWEDLKNDIYQGVSASCRRPSAGCAPFPRPTPPRGLVVLARRAPSTSTAPARSSTASSARRPATRVCCNAKPRTAYGCSRASRLAVRMGYTSASTHRRQGLAALRLSLALLACAASSPNAFAAAVASVAVANCSRGQAVNGTKVGDLFTDPKLRDLAAAAAAGDSAKVARLVREGADPNGAGREGVVPLVWAMGARNYIGMRALLAAGADPNARSAPGLMPLELAAKSSDHELLRILLDAKGDPNARNSDGDPLLYPAVMAREPANVRLLVERGADVNAFDAGHTTPVLLATTLGEWDQVVYLLEHGADPMLPSLSGGTVANELESMGAPINANIGRDFERVRRLLIARGVRFPAETPMQVRLRVFGPNNPIDTRIREEKARAAAPRGG